MVAHGRTLSPFPFRSSEFSPFSFLLDATPEVASSLNGDLVVFPGEIPSGLKPGGGGGSWLCLRYCHRPRPRPRGPSQSSTLSSTRSSIPGPLQARPKLRLVNALGLHRNHPRISVHAHAQNASLQCSVALIPRQAEYRLRYTALLRLCAVRDIVQISVRFTLSRRQVEKVPSTPRVYAFGFN